jgi:hypothetical protein
VRVAPDEVLRNREIAPFVIDMENDGVLSTTGEFRTQPADVETLVTIHAAEARRRWGLGKTQPMDVAIYAHGGLVGERDAAKTAAEWIPALYQERIFPIFLMWETDLFSTLGNIAEEALLGQPRPAAGLGERIAKWWNERLEGLLSRPGSAVWDEMKENADLISYGKESGGRVLHAAARRSPLFAPGLVRLHLIGHSAGAIVLSHVVDRLCKAGWRFESVTFMAPAVRVDTFEGTVLPQLKRGAVKRYHQFHLNDVAEQADPTCKPILGYSRSLLYLVSRSFEGGVETPILGMQRHFERAAPTWGGSHVERFVAPSETTQSTTHGGFDDDVATRRKLIELIRGTSTAATAARVERRLRRWAEPPPVGGNVAPVHARKPRARRRKAVRT